jgi:putative hydrolase of the HAD superfamily
VTVASHGVELVVFDIGRVLLRICDDWKHACRIAGVEMPAGLGTGPPPPQFDDLARQYDTGRIDLETFAERVAVIGGFDADDVIRAQSCYLLGAYPGVPGLLDDLARAGARTACLSNTSDHHWRMMQDRSGPNYLPLDRLDHRFASHLVRMRKPDAEIYAHVERETGVAPGAIVFFDDVEENVAAARRRGWRGHRIDPAPDDPLPQVRAFLRGQGLPL